MIPGRSGDGPIDTDGSLLIDVKDFEQLKEQVAASNAEIAERDALIVAQTQHIEHLTMQLSQMSVKEPTQDTGSTAPRLQRPNLAGTSAAMSAALRGAAAMATPAVGWTSRAAAAAAAEPTYRT